MVTVTPVTSPHLHVVKINLAFFQTVISTEFCAHSVKCATTQLTRLVFVVLVARRDDAIHGRVASLPPYYTFREQWYQ